METPKEIVLNYKYEGNGVFILSVLPVDSAVYVWQKCAERTTNWEKVLLTENNITSIVVNSTTDIGKKFRCLVMINGKVTYFSKSLLISKDKMSEEKSYNSQDTNSYYQYSQKNTYHEPSVADTDNMDGFRFEQYCADILKKNGFSNVVVTQGSGDYGVDIVAEKDLLSYAIQCKCYSGSVGNDAVQEVYSGKSKYKCTVAVVLTNSYFTKSAKETAEFNSVILWDRDYLNQMIKNAYSYQNNHKQENKSGDNGNQSKKDDRQENNQNSQHSQERSSSTNKAYFDYFKGCSNWEQVRDRYRGLMKAYHPDSGSGDIEISQDINSQYEKLKEKYGK